MNEDEAMTDCQKAWSDWYRGLYPDRMMFQFQPGSIKSLGDDAVRSEIARALDIGTSSIVV